MIIDKLYERDYGLESGNNIDTTAQWSYKNEYGIYVKADTLVCEFDGDLCVKGQTNFSMYDMIAIHTCGWWGADASGAGITLTTAILTPGLNEYSGSFFANQRSLTNYIFNSNGSITKDKYISSDGKNTSYPYLIYGIKFDESSNINLIYDIDDPTKSWHKSEDITNHIISVASNNDGINTSGCKYLVIINGTKIYTNNSYLDCPGTMIILKNENGEKCFGGVCNFRYTSDRHGGSRKYFIEDDKLKWAMSINKSYEGDNAAVIPMKIYGVE